MSLAVRAVRDRKKGLPSLGSGWMRKRTRDFSIRLREGRHRVETAWVHPLPIYSHTQSFDSSGANDAERTFIELLYDTYGIADVIIVREIRRRSEADVTSQKNGPEARPGRESSEWL
ncbi:hypothetical protein EVAR_54023_1 [Eumeta japonica]|uniref:Uncharacterized protein n=1 Tax=Eumeta variegata TaxID=151549 RepID=A0A4C1XW81_EUMVA|nr:hypothetical protein EVAR_54023_1 [Eumeta japonica]